LGQIENGPREWIALEKQSLFVQYIGLVDFAHSEQF
jgi:hypothetical protein